MNRKRSYPSSLVLPVGILSLMGCHLPQQRADVEQIPQITKLVEKATAVPQVHRFRKPRRDERARILRRLSARCDQLIADIRARGASAEALTGSVPEDRQAVTADIQLLEMSLTQLAIAARKGDVGAIRSAHATVVAAYTLTHNPIEPVE